MSALHSNPDLEYALTVGVRPPPEDERTAFNAADRPAQFGDDVIDNVQGVLNIARNASIILRAPTIPRVNAPAIAIGGGPSIARHIPALRALQNKCLLVCSQTTLKGLLEHDIQPHLVTPMERPEEMIKYMPSDCGRTAFAGAPLVAPSVMRACKRHYYAPSLDGLYLWTNLPGEGRIFFGSSTGTTAVNIATQCCRGNPIYLVGHDLAYDGEESHWGPSQGIRYTTDKAGDYWIEGNNGQKLRTEYFWKRLCQQISDTVPIDPEGREFHDIRNVNAADGIGALIPRTKADRLPDPSSLPDLGELPYEPVEERLKAWKKHARRFRQSAHKMSAYFDKAKDLDEKSTDGLRAAAGPNGFALSYCLVSVFAQISYECRMNNVPRGIMLDWFKTATRNALRACDRMFAEVDEHAAAA